MKKLLLLTAILICSFASYAQDYYRIYAVTIGYLNRSTQEVDWGEDKKTEMQATIKGNVLFISDKAQSTYTTYQELPLKDQGGIRKQVAWRAVDENNNKCVVKLMWYYKGIQMIYIIYERYSLGYYFEYNN